VSPGGQLHLAGQALLLHQGRLRRTQLHQVGLELVDQAGALDGERGLVGEGLEQRDLARLEADPRGVDDQHAHLMALSHQRHAEAGP
jgi:hypothetical protein